MRKRRSTSGPYRNFLETEPRSGNATTTEHFLTSKLLILGNLVRRNASAAHRRRFGLKQEEWRIVALLGSDETAPLNVIALRAGLAKSQISRGAASLVGKKLVSRVSSAEDNREAELHLTRRGRRIHSGIVAAGALRSLALADGLSAKEIELLHRTLDLLIKRAKGMVSAE